MIFRGRYALLFAVAVVLRVSSPVALAGAYSVDVFNGSEDPIELINPRTGRPLHTINPGRSLAVSYANGVDIQTPDGRRIHYERVDPPREFIKVGMLSSTFKVQLGRDLSMWVVPPSAKRPVLPPPAQPPGFPLSVK